MELINTISTSRTWTRHGLKITYAFGILLLLLALSSVVWHAKTQNRLKAQNYQAQEITPLNTKNSKAYQINNVVHANLFGDPNPRVPVKENAPKTTLDLKLQGVLSASDSTIARAIISSGSNNSKLYSVGDKVKGSGVSIEEIRSHEVLLNRSGAIESLPLIRSASLTNVKKSIISYKENSSNDISTANFNNTPKRLSSSTSRPQSTSSKPRKIKKPNFSGLDRALEKMGEI